MAPAELATLRATSQGNVLIWEGEAPAEPEYRLARRLALPN
jgi:hypothetical protein